MRTHAIAVAAVLLPVLVCAAPQVANPGFEADRYGVSPGYARQNGGTVHGWEGGSGVNPVWLDREAQRRPEAPFLDNGAVPEGRQVAFIQGPGRLSQRVPGFEKGKRYRVTFRENARVQRKGTEWPRVRVLLGGQVVVSPHEVTPVALADDFRVPFCRVESGEFVAPADGAHELVLETVQTNPSTTLILDDVRVVEVQP